MITPWLIHEILKEAFTDCELWHLELLGALCIQLLNSSSKCNSSKLWYKRTSVLWNYTSCIHMFLSVRKDYLGVTHTKVCAWLSNESVAVSDDFPPRQHVEAPKVFRKAKYKYWPNDIGLPRTTPTQTNSSIKLCARRSESKIKSSIISGAYCTAS